MQEVASVAVVEPSPPAFRWTKDEMTSGVLCGCRGPTSAPGHLINAIASRKCGCSAVSSHSKTTISVVTISAPWRSIRRIAFLCFPDDANRVRHGQHRAYVPSRAGPGRSAAPIAGENPSAPARVGRRRLTAARAEGTNHQPAARCKPKMVIWRSWSCASVSGLLTEPLNSWPSWISARVRSHSRLGPEGQMGHLIANALARPFSISFSNSQTLAGKPTITFGDQP